MCSGRGIEAVKAVEAYQESKKALDAVVWVSEGPTKTMRILGFTDPDEVTEGEIVE